MALNWGLWPGLFFLASSSLVNQKDLQVPGGARLFHASLPFITLPPVLELKPFTTLQTQVKHHHFCVAILALFSVLGGNGHFLLGATPCPQHHFCLSLCDFLTVLCFLIVLEIILPMLDAELLETGIILKLSVFF